MANKSSTPGILLRHCAPKDPSALTGDAAPAQLQGARATKITHLVSNTEDAALGYPRLGTLYEVENIEPLLSLTADELNADGATDSLIYKTIKGGRERPDLKSTPAIKGTFVIAVGITPKPENVEDLHEWYNQEHIDLLSKVPGWRRSVRYELVKAHGSGKAETPFIAFHFYDKENGVGGPEFQYCVDTAWTKKVVSSAVKPNYRRKWEIVEQEVLS
ncbi:MAG: hypothetical protein M4579_005636 [Chaenotheca gracillima]|nr:MAG: hypothetical protein M4579_005636 [Chaenotheca gracillima]